MASRKKKAGISSVTIYKIGDDFPMEALSHYEKLSEGEVNGCTYEIFSKQKKNIPPAWQPLIEPLIEDPSQIPRNSYASLVTLFKKDDNNFALAAGYGYADIQKHAVEDFGIDIACKCLDPNDLDYLFQKCPTGNVYGLIRSLRGKYLPTADPINRRSVLKALRGKPINKDLGLMVEGRKSLSISGKKDFAEVISLIDTIARLDKQAEMTVKLKGLNEVGKELKEDLNSNLINRMREGQFHDLLLGNDDDLILRKCQNFRVGRDETAYPVDDVAAVLNAAKNQKPDNPAQAKITGLDDNGLEIFDGPLMNFIEGELDDHGEKYFRIDKRWYRTNQEYMQEVNEDFSKLTRLPSEYLGAWSASNGSYIHEGQFLEENCNAQKVLAHTQRIENIEFADLIDKENNYLVHVKRGKGAYLRNLFAQGFVSATLLKSSADFRRQVQEKYSIDPDDKYSVIFAVFPEGETRQDSIFTLFAKVDLLERQRILGEMGFDVQYCLIQSA